MTDVFISYSHQDRDVARRYADALQAAGLAVWWDDHLRSGEAFDEKIEAALRAAKAVVVLWSKTSVASRWVRAEATLADRSKTLVPVMIEPCERPIMFELTHTSELGHWAGSANDAAWLGFLSDVRRLAEQRVEPIVVTPPPTPLAVPPDQPLAMRGKRGEAPSLAVLPFTNRSGLPEDEVFAIGMVEDVIDALSLNAAVNVVSSSATARFRTGAIPDLAALARELDVRYVLEGNTRRVGESLRVTAQLVEPDKGRIVWTERFESVLSKLAAMQEELVVDVATQLDANVNRLEVERALKKPSDLTAWEAVTLANATYATFLPEDLQRGAELAARAVAIDPEYGLAHAFLAFALALNYSFLRMNASGEVALIRKHADEALRLDSTNSLVLSFSAQALGHIGEARLGLAHAEHAYRRSPNSYQVCAAMSELLTHCNRYDEAIELIDRTCSIAKIGGGHFGYHLGMYGWKGIAFMRASRWAEAEAVEDEILSLSPSLNFALMHKAILCQRDGRIVEARAFAQEVRTADPSSSFEMWEWRMSCWHLGSPTRDVVLDNLRAAWRGSDGAG